MSDADNNLGRDNDAVENLAPVENDTRDDSAEAIPYSSAVHINSPLDRSLRNDTATLTATYDPEGFAVDDKGNIKEALAAAAQITDENERLPHKTQFSRSEEHTSELQSLMRISYAVFCLKKTKKNTQRTETDTHIKKGIKNR